MGTTLLRDIADGNLQRFREYGLFADGELVAGTFSDLIEW